MSQEISSSLTVSSFFQYHMFHPFQLENPLDKTIALISTIALGVFMGLIHALCFLAFYDRNIGLQTPTETEKKTTEAFKDTIQPGTEETPQVTTSVNDAGVVAKTEEKHQEKPTIDQTVIAKTEEKPEQKLTIDSTISVKTEEKPQEKPTIDQTVIAKTEEKPEQKLTIDSTISVKTEEKPQEKPTIDQTVIAKTEEKPTEIEKPKADPTITVKHADDEIHLPSNKKKAQSDQGKLKTHKTKHTSDPHPKPKTKDILHKTSTQAEGEKGKSDKHVSFENLKDHHTHPILHKGKQSHSESADDSTDGLSAPNTPRKDDDVSKAAHHHHTHHKEKKPEPEFIPFNDTQVKLVDAKQLAEAGNLEYQKHLGKLYLMGIDGVPKKFRKAFHYYSKAAGQLDPFSIFRIGKMTHRGFGTKKDEMKAEELIAQAKELGDKRAANYHNKHFLPKALNQGL